MEKNIKEFIKKNEGLSNTGLSKKLAEKFDKGRSTYFRMISKAVVEGELFKDEDGKIFLEEFKKETEKPVEKKTESKKEIIPVEKESAPEDVKVFQKADVTVPEELKYEGKTLKLVEEALATSTSSVRQRAIAKELDMKVLRRETIEESTKLIVEEFGSKKLKTKVVRAFLANQGILGRTIDVCCNFGPRRAFHGIFKFTRQD